MKANPNILSSVKQNVYIYNTENKFVSKKSMIEACKFLNSKPAQIANAAESFKNYGYVKTHFVSFSPIEKFYTPTEVIIIFNNWLKVNLNKNIAKLKNMYDDYDEEYLYNALSYITEAINSPRSINHFEPALIFKYKGEMLDAKKKATMRQNHGEQSDFDVLIGSADNEFCYADKLSGTKRKSANPNSHSYINTFASEDDYFWNDKKYNCIDDYNSMKQIDVIGYILKEKFSRTHVDLFLEILQSDMYVLENMSKPMFKYATIVRRHKDAIVALKSKDKTKLSNTKYIVELVEKCWGELLKELARIKKEANSHTYKNIDDYTLAELR